MRIRWTTNRRGGGLALAAVCLAPFLTSCAASLREPPIVATPQTIPALRAFFRNDPSNVAMRMRLAEAERRAGQLSEAALLLEPVTETTPLAGFYLGLVREDQGRAADARRLYERYLARRPSGALSDQLRDHIARAVFTTTELAEMADIRIPTERLATLQAANPFQAVERLVPDPLVRDASAEAFGTEGFGRSGAADIVIQRPTGTGTGP